MKENRNCLQKCNESIGCVDGVRYPKGFGFFVRFGALTRFAKRTAGEGGSMPPKPVLLAHAIGIEGDGRGPVGKDPRNTHILRQHIQQFEIHTVIVGDILDRLEVPTTA